MTTMAAPVKVKKPKKNWTYFFIALPLMALVFAFSYVPLMGWYLAFVEYTVGQPILSSPFVGMKFFNMLHFVRSKLFILKPTSISTCGRTL